VKDWAIHAHMISISLTRQIKQHQAHCIWVQLLHLAAEEEAATPQGADECVQQVEDLLRCPSILWYPQLDADQLHLHNGCVVGQSTSKQRLPPSTTTLCVCPSPAPPGLSIHRQSPARSWHTAAAVGCSLSLSTCNNTAATQQQLNATGKPKSSRSGTCKTEGRGRLLP